MFDQWLRKRISAVLGFVLMIQLVLLPMPGLAVENIIGSPQPTDDAAIDSSNAGTNYNTATGSSQGLYSVSSGSTNKKYVYFKFDVSAFSDPNYHYLFTVAGKKGSSNTNVELSLYGIEDTAWSESTVTWNNAPVNTLSGEPLGKFTITTDKGSSPEVYTVDVTAYVRSHLAQGKVAFLLGDAASTGISVNIYSKEANGSTNPRPKLIVKEIIDTSSDTIPPAWANGSQISVSNLGTNFIHLKWPGASDNTGVTQYRISQNNTVVQTVYGSTYAYQATGLSPATDYTFKVEALDEAGNVSPDPLMISRTTLSQPIAPIPVVGVVASSSDGNVEINTIDNNLYTRWSASGDGQWIMYDLDETKRIGYVGIAFYKGDLRSTNLDIQTSNDASNWTTKFSGSSSGTSVNMQAFDIEDTDARYVRIVGHGNSDGSAFTSLTDVHVYPPFANGDTPVALIPNVVPGPPAGTVPFTQPGMKNADGTEHPLHLPNATTGRTLNVLDYGADPADNGTDDRPAIQAAIQAAAEGDEVFIPNGVYNLSSSPDGIMNLSLKTKVNLRGESETGTILKTSLNKVKNSTLFKSASQHDLVISHMTLTSTWAGGYSTDHKVNNPDGGGPDSQIIIANYGDDPSYNITIDHVTVEKYSRMGIRADNSHDVIVRNSTFRNATDVGPGGAGYGVAFQGMAKVDRLGFANDTRWNLVEDSSFEGPYLRHGALIQFVAHNNVIRNNKMNQTKLDAIDLHGELEYFNEVYGNLVTNVVTGGGVGLGNTGGTAPSNHSKSGPKNYIHDNTIRNAREGVSVSMGTPDTIIENNIIENTIAVDGATGINVLNGPGTIIKNNIIRGNTASGYWPILLEHDNGDQNANYIGQGDPQDVQIIHNTITGNANGIQLQAGIGIIVKGNILNNTGINYLKAPGVTAAEDMSDLIALETNAGALSPVFDPSVTAYLARVPYAVSSISVTPTAADSQAALTVNDTASVSGATYSGIPLNVGANLIQVKVTAQNQITKTYTLTVTREQQPVTPVEPSSNAQLNGLETSAGPLNPAFSPSVTEYEVNVPYAVSSVSVTPTASDSHAALTVNGAASVSGAVYSGIPLNVGANVVQVKVTAQNQMTKTYTIRIIRTGRDSHKSTRGGSSGVNGNASVPPVDEAAKSENEKPIPEVQSINGQKVAVVTLSGRQMRAAISEALQGTMTIAVEPGSAEQAAKVVFEPDALQTFNQQPRGSTLRIGTPFGGYQITPEQLALESWAAVLHANKEEIKLEVMVKPEETTARKMQAEGYKPIKAVSFTVNAANANGTVTGVREFTRYTPKMIPIDNTVNSSSLAVLRASTDSNGRESFVPVPFKVSNNDVTIYSKMNGTFVLVDHGVTFADVQQHWAKAQIEEMASKWIVQGIEADKFYPDEPVTRSEFAALLTRALGLGGSADAQAVQSFKDVPGDAWYSGSIREAVAQGIVSGYDDNSFRPDQTVTRQEIAVMAVRALQYAGSKEQAVKNGITPFKDQSNLAHWSKDAVEQLIKLQLMDGMEDGNFGPEAKATRAQSAVLISRLLAQLSFTNE
ncbi:S-layer homology domain-containing protein [Paenibacillus rigui]|uniref:Uncharacterized protein n=1 Tax=Paenibacillus rigui TaxID=554312 RepID=A0A229UM18_9BACL|nr:S-layer homology domain-containing protein [Paenibacillus rigui]OXM84423.1 hypothetical protein CF651_20625 [Paenibacillus rigui]